MKKQPLITSFLKQHIARVVNMCRGLEQLKSLLKYITQYPPDHYATYQGPHNPGGVDKFMKTRKFVLENVGNQHRNENG